MSKTDMSKPILISLSIFFFAMSLVFGGFWFREVNTHISHQTVGKIESGMENQNPPQAVEQFGLANSAHAESILSEGSTGAVDGKLAENSREAGSLRSSFSEESINAGLEMVKMQELLADERQRADDAEARLSQIQEQKADIASLNDQIEKLQDQLASAKASIRTLTAERDRLIDQLERASKDSSKRPSRDRKTEPTEKEPVTPPSTLDVATIQQFMSAGKLHVQSSEGAFLGNVNRSDGESDSLANKYGEYGSPYALKSIFNVYGEYGGRYSLNGAANPLASDPPRLYLNGKAIAYVSMNKTLSPRVAPDTLKLATQD